MSEQIISTSLWAAGAALAPQADETEDLDTTVEQRQLQVTASEHGWRVDKWLALRCPEFSRSHFQALLDEGAVACAGAPVRKAASKVKAGDVWTVELRPTAQAMAFVAEAMALQVVHEDEHLLVIDKPAGLVVHPAAGHWSGTLLNGLLAYHAAAARLPRAGIVHRLDKDTSGLMLVGKTQAACEALVRMIALRQVHRIYVALAQNPWRGPQELEVQTWMGRDPRQRLRMAVLPAGTSGAKEARTTVRRLDSTEQCCWVACKLHTGRTHQIRVHLASLGHTLVADSVYGGRPAWGMQRQALHAHRLVLSHPISGVPLALTSPLPADLAGALQTTGLHYNPDSLWQELTA